MKTNNTLVILVKDTKTKLKTEKALKVRDTIHGLKNGLNRLEKIYDSFLNYNINLEEEYTYPTFEFEDFEIVVDLYKDLKENYTENLNKLKNIKKKESINPSFISNCSLHKADEKNKSRIFIKMNNGDKWTKFFEDDETATYYYNDIINNKIDSFIEIN